MSDGTIVYFCLELISTGWMMRETEKLMMYQGRSQWGDSDTMWVSDNSMVYKAPGPGRQKSSQWALIQDLDFKHPKDQFQVPEEAEDMIYNIRCCIAHPNLPNVFSKVRVSDIENISNPGRAACLCTKELC